MKFVESFINIPEGIEIPDSIIELFNWIELNEYFIDTPEGKLGYLCDPSEESIGTEMSFFPQEDDILEFWFDCDISKIKERVYVFAGSGADGSAIAFWLDENGTQYIVHLGSQNTGLMCVLAENPIDFLRLIAIGYSELADPAGFNSSPSETELNMKLREWVCSKFQTSIPKVATDIVKHPDTIHDEETTDIFCNWVKKVNA